jgi:hypothetical protein
LEGVVVEAMNGEAVPWAAVRIHGERAGMLSDDDGSFRIAGLAPGGYRVSVTRHGYETTTVWLVACPEIKPGRIQLERSDDWEPSTMLCGVVVDDETDEPVPYVNVVIAGTLKGTMTWGKGRFVIEGTPPGNYEARVMRLGCMTERIMVTLNLGEPVRLKVRLKKRKHIE